MPVKNKARVVKLDPTPCQAQQLASHIGGARFCYNRLLDYADEQYKAGNKLNLSGYGLRKIWNEHKDEWAPWWSQNSKEAYSNAALNLGRAFTDFFKKKKGHPRFKKKSLGGSYTITTGSFGIVDSRHIRIPKIGTVHVLEPLKETRVSSIVVRQKADSYYATLTYEEEVVFKPSTGKTVGVDLGINALATLSTGEKITHTKPLERLERKRHRLARSVSRKKKGSANREKAKTKLARLQQKATNLRQDTLHKLTTRLVTEFDVIAIEDLNVKGMMKNHRLARSIAEASFYEFRRQLEYKTDWYGKKLVVADRWFPSTKTCSGCGNVQDMPLSKRVYECECGLIIDRDVNAALNLCSIAESASEILNACGETVRRGSGNADVLVSMKQESHNAKPHLVNGRVQVLVV